MNNKTNYSLIGFLVLFSISMMILFAYWLMQPSQDKEMQKYYIYFDESVLGLNIDAPVKYRGISVGKVTRLIINPKNSEQVEVLVDILKTTPIKSSTVAKLTPQGITGLSYINLSLGNAGAPPLLPKDGDKYAVIKTTPSLFTRLENTLGNVSENLSTTLQKTEKLLNDENQEEISRLLKNTAEFMSKINKTLDDKTIDNIHQTMNNLNNTTKKLDVLMPRIDKFVTNTIEWEDKVSSAFKAIMGSYNGIKMTMDLFKESLIRGDFNIKEISHTFVPTLNNTLIQTQSLMIKVEDVLNQHERSPGSLLIQEKIKKGPGE
jgi:phospholipid/cholesterol/gamma-HCH transport system substrate-binding protein